MNKIIAFSLMIFSSLSCISQNSYSFNINFVIKDTVLNYKFDIINSDSFKIAITDPRGKIGDIYYSDIGNHLDLAYFSYLFEKNLDSKVKIPQNDPSFIKTEKYIFDTTYLCWSNFKRKIDDEKIKENTFNRNYEINNNIYNFHYEIDNGKNKFSVSQIIPQSDSFINRYFFLDKFNKRDLKKRFQILFKEYADNGFFDKKNIDSSKIDSTKFLKCCLSKKIAHKGGNFFRYINNDTTNMPQSYAAIFTDAENFSGDGPTGLIQINAYWSWPLLKWYLVGNFNSSANIVLFRNILMPDLIISKLDNSKYELSSAYSFDTSGKVKDRLLNSFDLIRFANFTADTKLNIFTVSFDNNQQKFYFDALGALYRTGINDSIAKKELTVNSYTYGFNFDLMSDYNVKKSNFNYEFYYQFFYVRLFNNDYKQIIAPISQLSSLGNNYSTYESIQNPDIPINNFGVMVSYKTSSDKNSSILYIRLNNYTSLKTKFNNTSVYYKNSFSQIQVGVQFSIEKLFKGKSDATNSTSTSNKTN